MGLVFIIANIVIQEITLEPLDDTDRFLNAFSIKSQNKSFILFAGSAIEKQNWVITMAKVTTIDAIHTIKYKMMQNRTAHKTWIFFLIVLVLV